MKLIRWRVSGCELKDRTGRVDPSLAGGDVDVHYSRPHRRYQVRHGGRDRGHFDSVEAAKAFAEVNVAAWSAEIVADAKARHEQTARELQEIEARRVRRVHVLEELQGHGVQARGSDVLGYLVLDDDAAQRLLDMLRDLKAIEERGAV